MLIGPNNRIEDLSIFTETHSQRKITSICMSGVAFFTGISIAATGAILDDQNLKITGCALAILGIACFTVIQTNCWTERPVSVIHLEEI